MYELGIPLLDALDASLRKDLFARSVIRTFGSRRHVFLAGDPAHHAYFVVTGAVMLGARDAAGNEASFGLCLPGELVDEAGVVADRVHEVDAVASIASQVLAIAAPRLRAAVTASRPAVQVLALHLDKRLAWTRRAAQDRATGTVASRIAAQLIDLAEVLGHIADGAIEVTLPVDQTRLAALAGSSREMTCRTLRRFKAGGVVDYEGRRLRILRPDVLERLRCGAVRNAGRNLPASVTRATRAAGPFPSEDEAALRRSR